jgi:hypothetical protein
MDVILGYLHRIDLDVVVRCHLAKYLAYSLLDISSQYPLAVLGRPYQMVLGIVDCMARTLDGHASSLLHDSVDRNFAALADSSPATGRGILRPFS